MKKCSSCKKLKPLNEFFNDTSRIDGKYGICKKCRSIINRNWRKNNRKKYNNLSYAWNKKNPDKVKESLRKYLEKYPFKNRERWQKIKEKYGIGTRAINTYGLKLSLFVYDRAGRMCEKCKSENDLTIHHLDNNGRNNQEKGLPMNNDPKNLMVLCRKCHGSLHAREYWEKQKGGLKK